MSGDDSQSQRPGGTSAHRPGSVAFHDEKDMLFSDDHPNTNQHRLHHGHDPQSGTNATGQSSDLVSTSSWGRSSGQRRGRLFASKLITKTFEGAAPLKSVFLGRGSDGDGSRRVSSFGDSSQSEYDDSISRPSVLLGRKSAYAGESPPSPHTEEQQHENAATKVDRRPTSRSTMKSINEVDASGNANSYASTMSDSHEEVEKEGNDDASYTNSPASTRLRNMSLIHGQNYATRKLCAGGDGDADKNIGYPSRENSATDHRRRFTATPATSKDQFETRLEGKEMKFNIPQENATTGHHRVVSAPVPTAGDQLESRLKAKAMKYNPSLGNATGHHRDVSVPVTSSADSDESRIKEKAMKNCPSTGSAVTYYRGMEAPGSTANAKFENRLRSKMRKGNTDYTAMENQLSENIDRVDSANDQYEKRLKAKMEKGKSKNQPTKHSPSMENTDRTSSGACPSANEKYENRLKAKMQSGKKENKPTKQGPPMKGVAAAHYRTVSGASPSANDQFENRLMPKMESGSNKSKPMKSIPSVENIVATRRGSVSGANSSANDQFENRLKAKLEKEKNESKPMKSSLSMESTVATRHGSAIGAYSSANDQFENRLRAKMEKDKNENQPMKNSPSMENTVDTRHGSLSDVRGAYSSANDQFENRLMAKMEKDKNESKPMKSSPSMENTAATHHGSAIGAYPSANDQFENRLRAKIESGSNESQPMENSPSMENTAATCHGSVSGAYPSANDQFENRLRAKMGSGKNESKPMKDSTSLENTVATHHGSVNDAYPSANGQFETRLKAKMQKVNNESKPMKNSPSLENTAATCHGNVSGTYPLANDQFENRLNAKMESGRNESKPMKNSSSMENTAATHHGSAIGAYPSANDQFENRLRTKMGSGNNAIKPIKNSPSMENAEATRHGSMSGANPSANDQFENRLRAKMEKDKNESKPIKNSPSMENTAATRHGSVSGAHPSANDQFETRLSAKIQKDINESKPMKNSPSMDNISLSANYQYESRLKAKIGSGNNESNSTKSSSLANDQFENRLRAKMRSGNNSRPSLENTADEAKMHSGHALKHIRSMEVALIEEHADQGKYNEILQYLCEHPHSPPDVVTVALEKIGEALSLAHGTFDSDNGSREVITLNDSWVDVITLSTMSNHTADQAVQLAALRAIWSIVALNPQYAVEFTSNENGLFGLVSAMKSHPKSLTIQECGCGIASCLISNKFQAIRLLTFDDGAIVEILGDAINNCNALKALFKLLVASRQSEKMSSAHLIETIGCCTKRERLEGGVLTNAMDTVLGVMHEYSKHARVQKWGCRILSVLFSDGRLPNSTATESQHDSLTTLISNVLGHVEATTASPETPRVVRESAMCLLYVMSCCSDDLLEGKDETFSRIVIGIILSEPKSRIVAMYGCHCTSNVLCVQDNTSSVLCGVMEHFEEEEIADIAINSMALLTKEGFQAILTLLENYDKLIDSIVGCMGRHSNSSSIQIAGCDVLSNIALDRHVMNEICTCGGASRIISTLYHLQDSLTVCKAFQALANIIGTCDASILQESRAPKSVLRAMEANPMDICIQIRGATTLWNLGSCHSALQREIIQLGGIQIISKAMGNFIASEQMQEQGVISLWTLTMSALLELEVTSCAIEAIADAIAAHLASAKICKHGLGALSSLATSRSVVNDAEVVIDMVFSCMWMHSDSAIVQQGALAALSKISIDQSSNEVLQIIPADLDAIIIAMRKHRLVKDVQENAIILLRSFTFSPVNVNVMGQNPYLVGLIKTAMSNFQGSLRVNVEDLLRLLPSDNQ